MHRSIRFDRSRFRPEVWRRAVDAFQQETKEWRSGEIRFETLEISDRQGTWGLDSFDEFLAQLGSEDVPGARLRVDADDDPSDRYAILDIEQRRHATELSVTHHAKSVIMRVQSVFAEAADGARLPSPPPPAPSVFIGHGRSSAWRDLKDHLVDKHGYDVTAYETGARAGHTIRDILDDLLGASSFAILVMTAEDETASGEMRARQNVIHEAGLFQGRLGFARAVIVRESGVEMFSNLDGVQYIPYSNTIAETFGEILATLKREFPT